MFESPFDTNSGGLGTGVSPVGDVLGTVVGDANRGTIIAVDQGDPLAGGGTAPGRRVGFFAINAIPNKLNSTGWDLFNRSLNWTLGAAQTGNTGGTPTVTDELHWVITDHLGTPTVTTTQTGTIVHETLRYPYGIERHSTGAAVTDIDFTAQTKDPNTGLIDYNARHYDPLVGRFLMADPFDIDGLNLHTYVRNSPTNATDPSGYCTIISGVLYCGGGVTLVQDSEGDWIDPSDLAQDPTEAPPSSADALSEQNTRSRFSDNNASSGADTVRRVVGGVWQKFIDALPDGGCTSAFAGLGSGARVEACVYWDDGLYGSNSVTLGPTVGFSAGFNPVFESPGRPDGRVDVDGIVCGSVAAGPLGLDQCASRDGLSPYWYEGLELEGSTVSHGLEVPVPGVLKFGPGLGARVGVGARLVYDLSWINPWSG